MERCAKASTSSFPRCRLEPARSPSGSPAPGHARDAPDADDPSRSDDRHSPPAAPPPPLPRRASPTAEPPLAEPPSAGPQLPLLREGNNGTLRHGVSLLFGDVEGWLLPTIRHPLLSPSPTFGYSSLSTASGPVHGSGMLLSPTLRARASSTVTGRQDGAHGHNGIGWKGKESGRRCCHRLAPPGTVPGFADSPANSTASPDRTGNIRPATPSPRSFGDHWESQRRLLHIEYAMSGLPDGSLHPRRKRSTGNRAARTRSPEW